MNETTHYDVLHKMGELLETIDEALDYVNEGFTNFERTEVDVVLADIFAAMEAVHRLQPYLVQNFPHDDSLIQQMESFEDVIEKLSLFEIVFQNPLAKRDFFTNELSPTFCHWKLGMEKAIQPYLFQ